MGKTVRIGTRGSALALWQARHVGGLLEDLHPGLVHELVIIKTKGDKILDVPLAKVGGKGLFVKEIEDALLDNRIDLAVHSAKDMPAQIPDGLAIGAVPVREDPRDVLICAHARGLTDLGPGARVGTSSLRRRAQLLNLAPDLCIAPLRGNLDTRIKKLAKENLDAIIVAAAGVKRLGLEKHISQYMDVSLFVPAVGQGALCIETRENDPEVAALAASLDHRETRLVVDGERAFLKTLGGSCQIPVAGYGIIEKKLFTLSGLVADVDGTPVLKESISGPLQNAADLGKKLADRLLDRGGRTILEKLLSYEGKEGHA